MLNFNLLSCMKFSFSVAVLIPSNYLRLRLNDADVIVLLTSHFSNA